MIWHVRSKLKSFLEGIISAFDLSGDHDYLHQSPKSDRDALIEDWVKVGNDIRWSMHEYREALDEEEQKEVLREYRTLVREMESPTRRNESEKPLSSNSDQLELALD